MGGRSSHTEWYRYEAQLPTTAQAYVRTDFLVSFLNNIFETNQYALINVARITSPLWTLFPTVCLLPSILNLLNKLGGRTRMTGFGLEVVLLILADL